MARVVLHVYDVTNCASTKASEAIIHFNKFAKDAIGLGGIFHGGVEIFGQEWSYGFCERGSGVYSSYPATHPMYTFRESIVMGITLLDERQVNRILIKLSNVWDGRSYDLLSRNCNHFCDALCQCLGLGKIPGWLNRFATAADVAVEVAENTAEQFRGFQVTVGRAVNVLLRRNSFSVSSDLPGPSASLPRSNSMGLPALEDPPSLDSLGDVYTLCSKAGSAGDREFMEEASRKDRVVFTHIRQPFLTQKPPRPRSVTEDGQTKRESSSLESHTLTSKAEFRRRQQRLLSEEGVEVESQEDSRRFRRLLEWPGSGISERMKTRREELVDRVSQCAACLPSVHVSLAS